jgi:hypothetical protein
MNIKDLRFKTITFDVHLPVHLKIGNQTAKNVVITFDEKEQAIILKGKAEKKK